MDRITRHPLLKEVPLETVIDYAVDFMRILGIPNTFIEKVEEIEIKNYRAELPCDFYELIQIRPTKRCNDNIPDHTFRYSTDSFHLKENKHRDMNSDFTYKVQGNVIFFSPLKNGKVDIAYKAMPIDEDGYPLIPDNSSYEKALELYIKVQWFTVLFDTGKISNQILQNTQQEYSWAVGQASNNLIMPSIDQMEAISNLWTKALPDTTLDHAHGFKHLGTKEYLRTH